MGTGELLPNEATAPGRRSGAKAPGVPCVAPPGGCPSAPDPSGSGGGGRGGAGTWRGERVTAAAHEDFPGAYAGAGSLGDGDGYRMCVGSGSARPDATPGESSRHCSLALLCNCPPACLRCMGSARANRSGRSPGSEGKEFDGLRPLWAAGLVVTSWCGSWCRACR